MTIHADNPAKIFCSDMFRLRTCLSSFISNLLENSSDAFILVFHPVIASALTSAMELRVRLLHRFCLCDCSYSNNSNNNNHVVVVVVVVVVVGLRCRGHMQTRLCVVDQLSSGGMCGILEGSAGPFSILQRVFKTALHVEVQSESPLCLHLRA